MHAASGYPIVRLALCGHAGDHIELGAERSVPVYGMNRRSRDRESQSDTQTCKSIGDSVREAALTLRERQIPRVKQSASYECTTCGNGSRPHRLPASYRRNNPARHMVAAVMVVA
jgi:ribosomal protein L32